MKFIVRDQNGNRLPVEGSAWPDRVAYVEGLEASRVEGLAITLSDDAETIVVTVRVEES